MDQSKLAIKAKLGQSEKKFTNANPETRFSVKMGELRITSGAHEIVVGGDQWTLSPIGTLFSCIEFGEAVVRRIELNPQDSYFEEDDVEKAIGNLTRELDKLGFDSGFHSEISSTKYVALAKRRGVLVSAKLKIGHEDSPLPNKSGRLYLIDLAFESVEN